MACPGLLRRWLAPGDLGVTSVESDEHMGGPYRVWPADAGAAVGGFLGELLDLTSDVYRLPDAVANTVVQVARQALSDVRKHAQATHVDVQITDGRSQVTLYVADDGRACNVRAVRGSQHHGSRNMGLRVVELGGTCAVDSSAVGILQEPGLNRRTGRHRSGPVHHASIDAAP